MIFWFCTYICCQFASAYFFLPAHSDLILLTVRKARLRLRSQVQAASLILLFHVHTLAIFDMRLLRTREK